jgi:hypothetical protein
MFRIQSLVAVTAIAFIACSTGCRNRCNQPCGGGLFAGSPTIAPAPTYSLNIPSVAQNQPYYTPNNGAGRVNTASQAPLPNTGNDLNWRKSGSPTNPNLGNQPARQNTGQNILANNQAGNGRFVETNSGLVNPTAINPGQSVLVGGAQPNIRTAAIPATGNSVIDSRNFTTTQIDERQDPTRIPVTDATRVRATSQNFLAGTAIQPQQGFVSQTFAAQPFVQPFQPQAFRANTTIVGNQPFQPQAYAANTYIQPNNNASYSAAASNSVGWRRSEIGAR